MKNLARSVIKAIHRLLAHPSPQQAIVNAARQRTQEDDMKMVREIEFSDEDLKIAGEEAVRRLSKGA
jgi:hypothetical protein